MSISGQYLTYTEYTELGGTIQEMPFNLLEFEARKIIDYYTLGRLVNLETQKPEVKICIYNLIDSIQAYNDIKGKTSEHVGNYSVAYNTLTLEDSANKYSDMVKKYLADLYLEDGTPYLYIGID